jgi:uncharacterized SAM-binding protein YcdF (DUF218 family)
MYATSGYTLPAIGHWLDVGQQPDRRDYVMLLNGDPDTRPFEVADLFRHGKAGRVLITSANESGTSLQPKVHETARSILTRCGIPESKIDFVDSRCDNTFDEAHALKEFMNQHPGVTFSVVTNTYHTRRSRWVFRNVLGKEMSRVRFVSAKTDAFNATNWWKHEDGFVYYLAEFLKSIFYFLRYGHGFAWISAIVGLIGIGWWVRYRSAKASVV